MTLANITFPYGRHDMRVSDYISSTDIVKADQAWFWTEEWQALEAQADKDYAEGRYTSHATIDDFIDSLDS